jgi:hypothetical protein
LNASHQAFETFAKAQRFYFTDVYNRFFGGANFRPIRGAFDIERRKFLDEWR